MRRRGRRLLLGGPQQQSLLALFLLNPGTPLPPERLFAELWPDEPPDSAPQIVQNNVWRLRKLLGAELLVTRPGGYELQVEPEELDATRFERLAEAGRNALAGGDTAVAAAKLREALALWRGPVLAGLVGEDFAPAEAARLEELRLAAIEDRVEADLALGGSAELVAELETLVAQHPLRERRRAQLMLALYRAGRQADALAVYQQTRRLLVDDLGIEPGPALQRLERAILLQDPSLEAPPAAAAPDAPPPPVREVRKTVSVLAAELQTEGPPVDPEAARRPLGRTLEIAGQILSRHGASVDNPYGGTLVAVFGLPALHEDDPLRAVRAAVEVSETLARLEREEGVAVAVRAAVNTGEVVATDPGTAEGRPLAGDAVDVAVRLGQAAAPGEVLLAETTRRLVAASVRVAPAGPQGVWKLLEVIAGAPAIRRRLDVPLVGRARELAQLQEAFERAVRDRLPYLFTILGPAGIGKSRVALEFAASVEREATVLTGRCLPYGESITFWPVAEMVRQATHEGGRGLVDLLADEPDGKAVAALVAAAIGEAEAPPPPEETFWAVRKLLAELARERPLVLVFEDLHWAEPTLLDLVEHLADWTRDAPLLAVCLARPELVEDRPAWGGGKLNATSILLAPLSETESEALVAQLTAGVELPADAREAVMRAAEGNPLFLEQMFAVLSEGGFPSGAPPPLPPTIQALLAARIDRLAPAERAVLERAAVAGVEFWRGALVELSPEDPSSVDADLEMLVRRDLVRPHRSRFPDEEAYRFRHVLLRDAAYELLPKHERAELHERFAAWLERAGALDEIVGHHLEESYRYRAELGRPDPAVAARAAERLAAAGRRAYARADLPAAVGLLSRGAALLEAGVPGRVELLVDLGEALRETGDFERADAALGEAEGGAGDPGLAAHARVARLRLRLQTDPDIDTAEVLAEAERAVGVFEETGDDARLAKAWELLAWAPWFRCRAAAAEAALARAVEHARRAGDSRTEAQGLHLLVGAAWFGPLPVADAIRRCEEVLELADEHRRVTASALRALAGLNAMVGRFDEARDLVARGRAILDDLGLTVTAASAAETYGMVELLAGDPVAAELELRVGYDNLERMGETNVSILAALLAQALHAQGRDAEALAFAEASEQATPRDDLFAHVQWRAARALALGRSDEAESLARKAVELAAQTDFLVVHGDALLALAEVAPEPGERVAAATAARTLYERKGNAVAAARARALARANARRS